MVDRVLPKYRIYEQGEFSPAQRQMFVDRVISMRIVAEISSKTTNIPMVDSVEYRYKLVPILWVNLRQGTKITDIARLLHRTIAHACLLVFSDGDTHLSFSAATKRVNQSDNSRLTIEDEYGTDWIGLDSLPLGLELKQHPLASLKTMYESYCLWIAQQSVGRVVGAPVNTRLTLEQVRELQQEHDLLQRELMAAKGKVTKERQISRQIELNKHIKEVQSKIAKVLSILVKNGEVNP